MTEVVSVEEVPADGSYLFRVRDVETDEKREAILLRLDGDVAGWLNYCRHMTHVKLDKGSGAAVRNGEVICRNHGAMFAVETGVCTYGPCEGAVLEEVAVAVRDGAVQLVDDGYEYVGEGPIPEDDPGDLSSTSNFEF